MVGGVYFSGLASGLDTAAIIDQLMELERLPIRRLEERIGVEERRLGLFQTLNTNLLTLLAKATALKDPETFEVRTAVSSDPGLVSVSAEPGSVLGSFGVEVLQLARSQTISSTASWSAATDTIGVGGDVLINGVAIHLEATDTVAAVVGKINAADAGVSASLVQVSPGDYRISLVSETAGLEGMQLADAGPANLLSGVLGLTTSSASIARPLADGTAALSGDFGTDGTAVGGLLGLSTPPSGSITIDDGSGAAVTVFVDLATDSLADIAAKINAAGGSETAAVVAHEADGKTVYRLQIAGAGTLAFTDSGNVLEALGVLSAAPAQENQAGTDAIVKVNGLQIVRNSNTITDAIDGVTLNLLAAEPGRSVTVTLGRDTESIRTQIEEFVTAYNAVRQFVNQNTRYDPESRTAGALLGDYAVRQIEQHLSRIINLAVPADPGGDSGFTLFLSRIGITRDRYGVLQVDEAKLSDALADDIDSVKTLFAAPGGGIGAEAESILDLLTDPREGTIKFRTDAIRAGIDDMNDSIQRLEDRLVRVEERLIRQFAALETTLAQFQQLGSFLEQQLLNLGNIWNPNQSGGA